jgi:hypothetical protein
MTSSHTHFRRILAVSAGLALVLAGMVQVLDAFGGATRPGTTPMFRGARLFALSFGVFSVFLVVLRKRHPGLADLLGPVAIEPVEQEATAAERKLAEVERFLSSLPKFVDLLKAHLDETNRIGGESALSVLGQIAKVQGEASRLLATLTEVKAEATAMCGNAQALILSGREKLEEMGRYTRLREAEIHDDSQAIERIVALAKDLAPLTGAIGTLSRQTRLIALNAAIQAASDQSVGRGFVAVADEMRRLAVQIESASKQVDGVMRQVARTVEEKLVDMASERRVEAERNWLQILTDSMSRMSVDFEAAVFGLDRLSGDSHAAVQTIFAAVMKTQELAQCQDISRQQIELVQNGLSLFGERIRGAAEAMSTGSDADADSLDEAIRSLEGKYAMRTQRTVHDRVVRDRIDEARDSGPAIELF